MVTRSVWTGSQTTPVTMVVWRVRDIPQQHRGSLREAADWAELAARKASRVAQPKARGCAWGLHILARVLRDLASVGTDRDLPGKAADRERRAASALRGHPEAYPDVIHGKRWEEMRRRVFADR